MKKFVFTIIVIAAFAALSLQTFSQSLTLEILLKNQPGNFVVLGKVSGDNFYPVDTLFLRRGQEATTKKADYTFPINAGPGMYRLVLGKTTYAKVMDEAPQQFDFIFNNEDLIFETDFEMPVENLLVVLSEENRVWFEFLQKEKIIQDKLEESAMEMDYYGTGLKQEAGSGSGKNEGKWEAAVEMYNSLQVQREEFINEMIARNPGLFATKLIKMYREPFINGNHSKEKRNEVFRKEYFNLHDFSDESLMNSSVYTDKVFQYLTSYNHPGFTKTQLEKEYIKAVDVVLTNVNKNPKVYEFILGYLVHGFEVLKMDYVLNYIADNYSGSTCKTDEKTTLERKLEAKKMKVGTTVPDFSLTDSEGFIISLSDVQKEKTLILFWASWCPHCKEMIPQIKSWAANQDDLQVVAVSLDTSKTEWLKAISDLGIENWVNLSDLKKWDGKVATEYNIYATPTMFIIDNNKKIRTTPLSVSDLNDFSF
ncbi:MAG TPA: TlpA disulfide reductase family protein [Prolixibacteraceae bacterium]|nr:TlpA disulfide reductase family protein [Prolixibacteraceae bacterium]